MNRRCELSRAQLVRGAILALLVGLVGGVLLGLYILSGLWMARLWDREQDLIGAAVVITAVLFVVFSLGWNSRLWTEQRRDGCADDCGCGEQW